MTSHYVFEPEFCNPAAGWGEPLFAIGSRTMASGQVEKNVQDARHQILQLMPDFPDLAAMNAWLEERCIEQWARLPHGTLPGTIAEAWAAERAALMPTPPAFDGFVERRKRVSPTCLISFERTRYSVPCSGLTRPHWGHGPFAPFANRPVSLRIYPDRLVVVPQARLWRDGRGAHRLRASAADPALASSAGPHGLRLAALSGRPAAQTRRGSRNGAPFTELPEAFRRLQQHLLKRPGGDREMVEILALVLHHVMPEACLRHGWEAVLCAVELALEAGVPTKTHVLNLLHRLVDERPADPPEVAPPSGLALAEEPRADVERVTPQACPGSDGLRGRTAGVRHAS
jgi:hypothetical protein